MRAVRVRVTGIVQGVGYRAWTRRQARAHGLDGWVRNRADGTVEAVIAGPDAAIDTVLAELRRGPPSGEVRDVSIEAAEMPEAGFVVLPTL